MEKPSINELLANINPHYHKAFQKGVKEHLRVNEIPLFAMDFSACPVDPFYRTYRHGVLLATNQGLVRFQEMFNWGINYYKKGSIVDQMNGAADIRKWSDPDISFKEGWQVPLKDCDRTDRDQIDGVVANDYSVTHKQTTYALVEMKFSYKDYGKSERIVVLRTEGTKLLAWLNSEEPEKEALHPTEELLLSLKRLFDAGLLTEEEYSEKKKEILSRM